MPEQDTNELIVKLKADLSQRFPDFSGLYLFGSRARGDYNNESDYDVALIFNNNIDWKFKDVIFDLINDYVLKYNIFIDTQFFNKTDFENTNSPLKYHILKEGIFYGI